MNVPEAVRVADLRSAVPACYVAQAALGAGICSPFGPGAPFGSAAFAAADARGVAPPRLEGTAEAVPGFLAGGSLWPGQRYVVRIPERWNGRLVVAAAPALRSEFACDLIFGDPFVAAGFAYACGNKGEGDGIALLEPGAALEVDGATLPRFPLPGGRGASFWLHAPGHSPGSWVAEFLAVAEAAQWTIAEVHGAAPALTYAVGLSNGGYVVRRAIEESSGFAGGLTWNAVLWTPAHNVLRPLPEAVAAMHAGRPERIPALGFPPDVAARSGNGSLYAKNLATYWTITAWLHAAHLDASCSQAFGDVREPGPAEALAERIGAWRFDQSRATAARVATFSNTGHIRAPLIDVAAQFDHLVPPAENLDPYARLVAAAGAGESYRSVVVRGAQHVDSWSEDSDYPSMQPAHPDVLAAFDDLVTWVEGSAPYGTASRLVMRT